MSDKDKHVGDGFRSPKHTRIARGVELGFTGELMIRASVEMSRESDRNRVNMTEARPLKRRVQ